MHTWTWQTWNDLPYLTCSLLEPWPHGFFTQQFAPRLPEELTRVLHPDTTAFRLKQVHGNRVMTPSEVLAERSPDSVPPGDGIVSETSQQSVWVCSADCTPALIADARTGQVAAVHAGWRGTSQKIIPRAIERLQAQGSRLADLRIVLGPAIAGEVYQVSEQVAAAVGATVSPIDSQDIPAVLESLRQLPNPPVLDDAEPGRARLDVRRINALQLEQLDICAEQVAIAPHCTYQTPDHFFSYRRERQKKAQWSGIVSRSFSQ